MARLQVTIRAARADDRSMMYLLAEENLHPLAVRAGHPERFDSAGFLALLEQAEVYVAESETQEIAGYVAFDEEPDAIDLRCLCVSPAYEAQMVANQLMDWVEGLAISRGRDRLTAFVPAADDASLHLYHRHDFVVLPSDVATETVTLEKRLPRR